MPSSFDVNANVKLNSTNLNASAKKIEMALGRITGQASEFQKSLDASTARVFAFGATTLILNSVNQAFKKLVATTIEVEKKLIEINSIFQASEKVFNRFRNSIFRVAKETGQAFETVADGAAELARQGLSAEETAKRLKAALVLTRISGLGAEKSVKALTAAINGFASAGLSANQIVNKMVAVDTAFAVSAQDLAEAFSRAGSTAEDAGVSFNELLGLVTAVEQKTARGGAVIGNAFKSIFTRLSRGDTIESLRELGVEITSAQSGVQKLGALSAALDRIADPTVASKIKELAGGVFQINVVSAALKDLSSETSIFAGAATTAANATNEAFDKNADLNKALASQINALVVGLTSLAARIGDLTFGPLLENLVGLVTKFTGFLDTALDPEKGNKFIKGFFGAIKAFLSGPAVVIFTAAFIKIFALVARFAKDGLKSVFAIGSEASKIKNIEGGIVGLLQKDKTLRQIILSSTTSQATKEAAIINAIRQENALLTQQAALMSSIATAARARGVASFSGASGRFAGRKGMAFAGGFQQEEAIARGLGAGNSVKAHFGQGKIGGRKFIMNNQEAEIPNFKGGMDSAVIPMYGIGAQMNAKFKGPKSIPQDDFIKKFGQVEYNVRTRAEQTGMRVTDRGTEAKKLRAERKRKKGLDDRIKISGTHSAMLIPKIKKIPVADSVSMKKGHTGTFMSGKTSHKYIMTSGVPIHGPHVPKAVDQAADPQDEKIKKNIKKSIAKAGAKYANLMNPTLTSVSAGGVKKQMGQQLGGKGAVGAAVGAAFEAAVILGLNANPLKNSTGGDFDIKKGLVDKDVLSRTRGLFGIKNQKTNLMDFKSSKSDPSKNSFAKKLALQQGATTKKRKGKAAGYIPKFGRGNFPKRVIRKGQHSMDRPFWNSERAISNAERAAASGSSKGKSGGGGMGGMGAMGALFGVQMLMETFGNSTEDAAGDIDAFSASVKVGTTVMSSLLALQMAGGAVKGAAGWAMGAATAGGGLAAGGLTAGITASAAAQGGMLAAGSTATGLGALGTAAAVPVAAAAAALTFITAGLWTSGKDLLKVVPNLINGTTKAADETFFYGKLLGGSTGAFQNFFDNIVGVGDKATKAMNVTASDRVGQIGAESIMAKMMGTGFAGTASPRISAETRIAEFKKASGDGRGVHEAMAKYKKGMTEYMLAMKQGNATARMKQKLEDDLVKALAVELALGKKRDKIEEDIIKTRMKMKRAMTDVTRLGIGRGADRSAKMANRAELMGKLTMPTGPKSMQMNQERSGAIAGSTSANLLLQKRDLEKQFRKTQDPEIKADLVTKIEAAGKEFAKSVENGSIQFKNNLLALENQLTDAQKSKFNLDRKKEIKAVSGFGVKGNKAAEKRFDETAERLRKLGEKSDAIESRREAPMEKTKWLERIEKEISDLMSGIRDDPKMKQHAADQGISIEILVAALEKFGLAESNLFDKNLGEKSRTAGFSENYKSMLDTMKTQEGSNLNTEMEALNTQISNLTETITNNEGGFQKFMKQFDTDTAKGISANIDKMAKGLNAAAKGLIPAADATVAITTATARTVDLAAKAATAFKGADEILKIVNKELVDLKEEWAEVKKQIRG